MTSPNARPSTKAPSLLASFYADVAVLVALQLYRLLMLVGRCHAHFFTVRAPLKAIATEVNTYPQEALFGYDWYVWRFMLPWMWRADAQRPLRLYDATISTRTLEVGPGSAYFPHRSKALKVLTRRSLVASSADAHLVYDLLDLNPVPLEYTHSRLQRIWTQVAHNVYHDGLVPSAPTMDAFPSSKTLTADITNLEQLDRVLAQHHIHPLYTTLVANLIIHCVPYARSAAHLSGDEMARIKMATILTGMARLIAPGGSLVGCTVLGTCCNDWAHSSAYTEAAAVKASAMLRSFGIFDNEFDSLQAFLHGAKTAGLEVRVAHVAGNLLSFHLVKPPCTD